jgi:hypothetical protein
MFLALMIVATAGAWFSTLSVATGNARQQLQSEESAWRTLTQELAKTQAEREASAAKVKQLEAEVRGGGASAGMDPALAVFLLSNDGRPASPEIQNKILAELRRRGGSSSASYVLVSKAALRTTTLPPLKPFPESHRLSDAVRGLLAITPEEQQSVEAAFARSHEEAASWAKANVQREGPSGNMLARYTIPAGPAFEQASTERLFSVISATLGKERSELLRGSFEFFRIDGDGAIGNGTNILEIYRTPGQATLGYRAGLRWKTSNGSSEAINTDPVPIQPDKFPVGFSFVFPGGWREIAQRESFELPEGASESSQH